MSQPREQQHLRKQWDRWVGVVRKVESRQGRPVSARRYAILYQTILDACKEDRHAGVSNFSPSRRLHGKIRKLVEPWVSLETLLHSDRRILRDLLMQAREVEDVMHPRLVRVSRPIRVLFAALLIGVCLFAGAIFLSGEDVVVGSLLEQLELVRRRLKLIVAQATVTQWLGLVTLVVVVFGLSLTVGTRKS